MKKKVSKPTIPPTDTEQRLKMAAELIARVAIRVANSSPVALEGNSVLAAENEFSTTGVIAIASIPSVKDRIGNEEGNDTPKSTEVSGQSGNPSSKGNICPSDSENRSDDLDGGVLNGYGSMTAFGVCL